MKSFKIFNLLWQKKLKSFFQFFSKFIKILHIIIVLTKKIFKYCKKNNFEIRAWMYFESN